MTAAPRARRPLLLPVLLPGLLWALLSTLLLGAGAAAGAESEEQAETELMYQQALQSIAEGRKTDASETLSRVIAREPLHAGAWLDLALIQCALGHADEAERLFDAIVTRFRPPAGITALIAQARAGGCNNWQPLSQASVSFARGIGQNVNQGANASSYLANQGGGTVELPLPADYRPRHDQYSLLSADYLRDLSANGSSGFVQFQARRYDKLGQYNSASLFAGIDTPWRFGRWSVHGSATVGLITLGDQLYQRQTQLQARVGPPLPLPGSMQFSLTAGVTHVEYLTLSNFNANTTELRGQFNYRLDQSSASATLAVLDDHALAQRPGGDRQGWQANLQWRHMLGDKLSAEVGLNHQHWRGSALYSPGFIDQTRRQSTQVLRAALSYPLTPSQTLQLEARQIRNAENISIFQYNDRQLQLSWQWQGL